MAGAGLPLTIDVLAVWHARGLTLRKATPSTATAHARGSRSTPLAAAYSRCHRNGFQRNQQ
jgi:hypothetical protein